MINEEVNSEESKKLAKKLIAIIDKMTPEQKEKFLAEFKKDFNLAEIE